MEMYWSPRTFFCLCDQKISVKYPWYQFATVPLITLVVLSTFVIGTLYVSFVRMHIHVHKKTSFTAPTYAGRCSSVIVEIYNPTKSALPVGLSSPIMLRQLRLEYRFSTNTNNNIFDKNRCMHMLCDTPHLWSFAVCNSTLLQLLSIHGRAKARTV